LKERQKGRERSRRVEEWQKVEGEAVGLRNGRMLDREAEGEGGSGRVEEWQNVG
jgi:hypothetical protein